MGTWNLGCFLSAILTIFLGDYLGRKKTLMLGLSIWMIGELIQCTSYSFGQLIAGRFIAGFGEFSPSFPSMRPNFIMHPSHAENVH